MKEKTALQLMAELEVKFKEYDKICDLQTAVYTTFGTIFGIALGYYIGIN